VFRRRRRDDAGERGPDRADIRDDAGPDEAGSGADAEFDDDAGFDDDAELDDDAEFEDDTEQADGPPRLAAAAGARAAAGAPGGPRTGGPRTGGPRTSGGPAGQPGGLSDGPWDGAGTYPDAERMDFGSLLVPAREGLDVQVNMAEDQGVWIAIVHGESALQLQAFAAPKTSGLWDEVRHEIADEVTKSGGESQEQDGPFGAELHARINPAGPGQRRQQLQPVRFMGVDGPRWFLRGVISGPAAHRPELAAAFEELFSDVVVVRGDHPAPPRDLLEIRLPEEARRALEEQMAEAADGQEYPNPFDRGPEITETR
jgi:hypothetical protein